jgi:putative protease
MEYECFVHGAMCLGVSGRCLMSNFLHGKSANRGECYQPCRRKYRVYDWERDKELAIDSHTIMSAKDLCTVNILDKIINTGVSALKIEGRMRDPGYVKKTVEVYRAARDSALEGRFSDILASEYRDELDKVFNRGFSDGFYLSRPDSEISETEGSISKEIRSYRGKVTNYYSKQGAADIFIETGEISIGDIIQITGPTTGIIEFQAETIRDISDSPVEKGFKGWIIGLKTPVKTREGDSVYVVEKR